MLYKAYVQFMHWTECKDLKVIQVVKILLRIGLIFLGVWVVWPLIISRRLVSDVTRIETQTFLNDIKGNMHAPDILFCSPLNTPLKYKALFNQSQLNSLEITDEDLSEISFAAMNGSTPQSERIARIHGFRSDKELWNSITVPLDKLLVNPSRATACRSKCKKGKEMDECQICMKSLLSGWVWHKKLRTRCARLNSTAFVQGFIGFGKNSKGYTFAGVNESTPGRISPWVGNLETEPIVSLYDPSWIQVKGIFFVSGKKEKALCHDYLSLDFGEPFQDCSTLPTMETFTLWNINKGPDFGSSVKDVGDGSTTFTFGLWRIDDLFMVNYTREFKKILKLELGLGASDSFSGMNVILILGVLFMYRLNTKAEKNRSRKLCLLGFKAVIIALLLALFGWLMTHTLVEYFENLYIKTYSVSMQPAGQPLPGLRICSGHNTNRWFNRTKLRHYNVTSKLFQYLSIVGHLSYPYSYGDPGKARYFPNGTKNGTKFNEGRPYRDLFAFQNRTISKSELAQLNADYEELVISLGMSLDEPPYKVVEELSMNKHQWIKYCEINGEVIANCSHHFHFYKTRRHGDVCWEYDRQDFNSKEITEDGGLKFLFDFTVLAGNDSDFLSPYLGSEYEDIAASYGEDSRIRLQGYKHLYADIKSENLGGANFEVVTEWLTEQHLVRECQEQFYCPNVEFWASMDYNYIAWIKKQCGCNYCQDYPSGADIFSTRDCCPANVSFPCLTDPKYFAPLGNCDLADKSQASVLLEAAQVKTKCVKAYFYDSTYPTSGVIEEKDTQCPKTCDTIQFKAPEVIQDQRDEKDNLTEVRIRISPGVFVERLEEEYNFRFFEFLAISFSLAGALFGISLLSLVEFLVDVFRFAREKMTGGWGKITLKEAEPRKKNRRTTMPAIMEDAWEHRKISRKVIKEGNTDEISTGVDLFISIYFIVAFALFLLTSSSLIKEMKEKPYSVENTFMETHFVMPGVALCANQTQRRALTEAVFEGECFDDTKPEDPIRPCDKAFPVQFVNKDKFCLLTDQWMEEIPSTLFQQFRLKLNRDKFVGDLSTLYVWMGDPVDLDHHAMEAARPWEMSKADAAIEYVAVKRMVDPKFLLHCNKRSDVQKACPPCQPRIGSDQTLCCTSEKVGTIAMGGHDHDHEPCEETHYKATMKHVMLSKCPHCCCFLKFCSRPKMAECQNASKIELHVYNTDSMAKAIVKTERYDFMNILAFCLGYIGLFSGFSCLDLILLLFIPCFFLFKTMKVRGEPQKPSNTSRRESYRAEETPGTETTNTGRSENDL